MHDAISATVPSDRPAALWLKIAGKTYLTSAGRPAPLLAP